METIDTKALNEVTRRIVEAVHPEKIVLFGSHAWGTPTADSDIDLLVVLRRSDQPGYRRAREIYRSLRGLTTPVDVVVRTHAELERGMSVNSSLEHRIMAEGMVLHG